jgi:hypothetical protein
MSFHEHLLFDTNGQIFIDMYNNSIFSNNHGFQHSPPVCKKNILKLQDTRCFSLNVLISSTDTEIANENSIYFKTHIIIEKTIINKLTGKHVFEYEVYPHDLPMEMLFTIKYFQARNTRDGLFQFNSHRECFVKNVSI